MREREEKKTELVSPVNIFLNAKVLNTKQKL